MPSLACTPASATPSPCDIFATASELQTQLAALEKRTAESAAARDEFVLQRRALLRELHDLEVSADAERTTTCALHAELEMLQRDSGTEVVPFTFVFPAEAAVGDSAAPDGGLPRPAGFFARNVIPESWKNQLGRTVASNVKARARLGNPAARCVSDTLAREHPTKPSKMRRTLSEKVREKRKRTAGNKMRKAGEGDGTLNKRNGAGLRV